VHATVMEVVAEHVVRDLMRDGKALPVLVMGLRDADCAHAPFRDEDPRHVTAKVAAHHGETEIARDPFPRRRRASRFLAL
jgi:hypothetical protein